MSSVVSLHLVVHVVEHHHSGHEVHHLARRQQVQIVAAVLAAVAVTVATVKETHRDSTSGDVTRWGFTLHRTGKKWRLVDNIETRIGL